MATAIVPGIYDKTLADANVEVSTEEAQRLVRCLAREEGMLVGISSGAALAACFEVARGLKEGKIVTVFPDSGDKYLSERFWEEEEE
jgi:cysteine synthase B